MSTNSIAIEASGAIATIQLKGLHDGFFNKKSAEELAGALRTVEDDSRIKYVLFRGAPEHFCRGLDVANFSSGKITVSEFGKWEQVLNSVEKLNKVTIAVIEGECFGAGIQLALACDVRIAAINARFMHNEIKQGILPGNAVFQIGKFCGLGKMMELVQTGKQYTAREAKLWGIVQGCYDSGSLDSEIKNIITNYEQNDLHLHQLVRRLSKEAFEMGYEDFLGCCLAAQHRALTLSVPI